MFFWFSGDLFPCFFLILHRLRFIERLAMSFAQKFFLTNKITPRLRRPRKLVKPLEVEKGLSCASCTLQRCQDQLINFNLGFFLPFFPSSSSLCLTCHSPPSPLPLFLIFSFLYTFPSSLLLLDITPYHTPLIILLLLTPYPRLLQFSTLHVFLFIFPSSPSFLLFILSSSSSSLFFIFSRLHLPSSSFSLLFPPPLLLFSLLTVCLAPIAA